MKKLILLSLIVFLMSCSSDDPKPTTYQIVNNMELDTDPAIEYLDGSMWEVIVFCIDDVGDVVREDKHESIIAGGGSSKPKEITPNIVKLVVSFKFLPQESNFYDLDSNNRRYTVTRFVVIPETNNLIELDGNTNIKGTLSIADNLKNEIRNIQLKTEK